MSKIHRASDFKPEDGIDLFDYHLPTDVVILASKKATGKSQMIAHWTTCIITGKEFVSGVKARVRGEVAIFHGERSIKKTLIPRLIAAGLTTVADRQKVHLPRVSNLEEAAERLRELLHAGVKLRLGIIDPLNALLDGKTPTNAKARKLLGPFLDLCEEHGICVVLVCHFTKSQKRELLDMIGGSGGWTQAAGSVWSMAKVKDGGILQHIECNTLDTTGQQWEYEFEKVPVKGIKRPISRVVMLGKSPVDLQTALDLGKDLTLSGVPDAKMKIKQLLADGDKPCAYVVKKLDAMGIPRITRERAQKQLHQADGKLKYLKRGRNTVWHWVADNHG